MKNAILPIVVAIILSANGFGDSARDWSTGKAASFCRQVDFDPATNAELKKLGFVLPTGRIKAPDFTLKDLNGQSRSLSFWRGKVVFLNFWGVWCYYCRLEMPSLQRFYDRLKEQGLEIVAVNVQDAEQTAREYITKNKHTFPVLLDKEYKAVEQYGPRGFPTTYLIDREGYLQAMLVGSREWDAPEIINVFKKLLASP
jgi:peroxiredoxin